MSTKPTLNIASHEWCLIEDVFDVTSCAKTDSLFSLGNGRMGQRGNFEEKYSGNGLYGNFAAGIYYPDPTKVGWWKNNYPDYFAKIVNLPRWIGIEINVDGVEDVDLAVCRVLDFKRTLNMRDGFLERAFTVELKDGKQLKVITQRFISMACKELGAIKYTVTPLNFSAAIIFTIDLNADIKNNSAYYDEYFLNTVAVQADIGEASIVSVVKKTYLQICTGMRFSIEQNRKSLLQVEPDVFVSDMRVANVVKVYCSQNSETTIYKYAAILSALDHPPASLVADCKKLLHDASSAGYGVLLKEHRQVWLDRWNISDVMIAGDIAAQQAIRFNIFQLIQSYIGDDARFNISPKGFTGEKYGGGTYWDTEVSCLPFYMCTIGAEAAKNLLLYRYQHLAQAIENAKKLGFGNGAAFYPMVTVNGEECHNEWEITFEEIHRNGIIAYAIYNYVNYTGDKDYLVDYGLEVLLALSRFWSQRTDFSQAKKQYVILGVTGPNEYENNVNNNWYTNTIAVWTLQYTLETILYVKAVAASKYKNLIAKINFEEEIETVYWQEIIANMYFPVDEQLGIFLQQENYLDKKQMQVEDLSACERPLNKHWSWDKILRSCLIKQADVLQGLYLFEERYDKQTIRRNFDFYDARTLHESTLLIGTHAILAAHIGYLDKAYELFLYTARLDLDDYNHEVEEGCHVTSMSGTWLSLVHGFGGMRVSNGKLHFDSVLPKQWQSYSFKLLFRKNIISVKVSGSGIEICNETRKAVEIVINNKTHRLEVKNQFKIFSVLT